MDFKTSKLLGGIGALIIVLEVIPTVFFIPTSGVPRIVGILLILTSINYLANFYQTKTIFTNAKFGAVAAIIGAILMYVTGLVFTSLDS
jgi:uncharacterized membrane protein